MLLRNKADVHAISEGNMTPMHFAVVQGNLETVQLLLEFSKPYQNLRDQWGNTPLDLAKEQFEDYEIAQLLQNALEEKV